jgi:hypothetical protein
MASLKRNQLACLIVLLPVVVALSCGHRDYDPGVENITEALSITIPTFFTIDRVNIDGQGDATSAGHHYLEVTPDWGVRLGIAPGQVFRKTVFSFRVTAKEVLFETVRQSGNVPIIRQVTDKRETATIDAVAGSTAQVTIWLTQILGYSNRSLPPGQPRYQFAADACVQGTSCEKAAQRSTEVQLQQLRAQLLRVWHGRYTCGQGESGVDVSLTQMTDSGAIRGTFSFFNLPRMHNTQPGSFAVTGQFDSSANILRVDPAGWINQPAGWTALGFTASPNADWSHMEGNITGFRGCGQIFLDR